MEFLLDADTGEFFFLEMNTRLQVEHPVTVTGPKCNLPFHAELLEHPGFVSGHYDTALVTRMRP